MSKGQYIIDALFSSLARAEEQLYPNATILPSFPRSIQLDGYSCGAKSTYIVLKYFGKRCSPATVEAELGTTWEGTSKSDIKRVLRKHRLEVVVHSRMNLRDLKSAINAGSPVLVSLYENWHYSVAYGYSGRHVFVMNPSLGSMGSVNCAVRLAEWHRIFDRWGIVSVQAGEDVDGPLRFLLYIERSFECQFTSYTITNVRNAVRSIFPTTPISPARNAVSSKMNGSIISIVLPNRYV
jgi:ABC-type bacteriocin/lantibiotic exporter with double-glycine peptidase domain